MYTGFHVKDTLLSQILIKLEFYEQIFEHYKYQI
jgi:hypothetical protein